MPRQDDDLLARLNALKPSSVKLDNPGPSIDVEVSEPQTVEDKLAERLRGLRAGSSSETSNVKARDEYAARNPEIERVKDEVRVEPHAMRDWQRSGNDEQTLEDLLAELGPEDQWKLDPEDSKNINALLEEAKAALPSQSETADDSHAATEDPDRSIGRNQKGHQENAEGDSKDGAETEDQRDEDEAHDYVQQILAELEMEKKYRDDEQEGEPATGNEEQSEPAVDLPCTPSNLPKPPTGTAPPSYEDSELEARFSKLGLDLPSTPNTTPSARARAGNRAGLDTLKKAKAKSDLPVYTDEDIDSWCCICNEGGEVRCLGCDGDIYCQKCWRDGHGDRPGQERGHRAVQYNRKGPAASAA